MSEVNARTAFARSVGPWGAFMVLLGMSSGLLLASDVKVLLFVLVLGAGALLAVLRHPVWLFPAILIASQAEEVAGSFQLTASFPVGPTKILALGGYIYGISLLLRRRRPLFPLLREPVTLVSFLLVFAAAFASTYSMAPMMAQTRVIQLASMVLFMLTMAIVTRPKLIPTLMLPALVLFTGTTLYDLANYSTGYTYGVEYMLGWIQRETALGADPNDWCLRIYSLVPLWAASISCLERRTHRIVMFGLLALVMVATPALTASRMGFLLMVMTTIVLYQLLPAQRALLKRVGGVALVAAPILIPTKALWARLQLLMDPSKEFTAGSSSLTHRSQALQLAVDHFQKHPLTGIGLESYKLTTGEFTAGSTKLVAHNAYATIASEQGLIGISLWGLFALSMFLLYWHGRKLPVGGSYRLYLDSLAAGLLVYSLGMATLNTLYKIQLWFLLGILVGLVVYGRQVVVLRGAAPLPSDRQPAAPAPSEEEPALATG